MKPVSNQKTQKTRSSSGSNNHIVQKKEAPFFQPKEGGEHSFFQPQAGQLPAVVQAKMENTMGEDFSGVNIHQNSAEATGMNALAFTQGENVHFAPGQYNPGTRSGQELIGHEFAHVKQQRQGRVQTSVQMKGRNVNNDSSLEAEADALGRRAAGASAEPGSAALGLRRAISSSKTGNVVQMMPKTDYGEFKTTSYSDVSTYGVEIALEFHPNAKVDATKIGLTQTVRGQTDGVNNPFSPTRMNRQTANGTYIDRIDERSNPIYGSQSLKSTEGLDKTADTGSIYKLGYRKDDGTGTGKWLEKPAYLYDRPTMDGRGNNSFQKFETAALGIEGTQKDMYFGSVNWGWEVDGAGTFKRLPLTLASSGKVPTAGFLEAARKWNAATALGTVRTKADPTQVYTAAYAKDFTLAKNTKVTVGDQYTYSAASYNVITEIATGKTGRVKTTDLVDMGDGAATTNLPIP
jgi:hypothetical protein